MKKYILFITTLTLLVIFFIPIFKYKKIKTASQKVSNYKRGVYHVHSLYSHDSVGKIEEIIAAAKNNNLDFVILTDHGRPNIKSSLATKRYGNVLLIGASEFTMDCGHMTAINYKLHSYRFAPEPQEAIDELKEEGAIEFIAHPFDTKIPWKNWNIRGFTGIELINTYSCIRRCNPLEKLIAFFYYHVNPSYSLLYISKRFNKRNFLKWDNLNNDGKYYGIYALDAHGNFHFSKKFSLNFPKYEDIFGCFNIYVKVDQSKDLSPLEEKNEIVKGLKKGNFFNVVELFGNAEGFETYFLTRNGKKIEMGKSITERDGEIFFKIPTKEKLKIKIFRNGKPFKIFNTNGEKTLKVKITERGVYRSEIFIEKSLFKDIPWIVTNPFYLMPPDKREKVKEKEDITLSLPFDEKFFSTRNDGPCHIKLRCIDKDKMYEVSFSLKKCKNSNLFGVAIYHKFKMDISRFKGVEFETRSSKKMRYFFVLRYKKGCYRHTFLSSEKWERIKIPFSKLVECSGKNKKLSLKRVKIFLISVNNYISYDGVKNTLYLKNLKLYR